MRSRLPFERHEWVIWNWRGFIRCGHRRVRKAMSFCSSLHLDVVRFYSLMRLHQTSNQSAVCSGVRFLLKYTRVFKMSLVAGVSRMQLFANALQNWTQISCSVVSVRLPLRTRTHVHMCVCARMCKSGICSWRVGKRKQEAYWFHSAEDAARMLRTRASSSCAFVHICC